MAKNLVFKRGRSLVGMVAGPKAQVTTITDPKVVAQIEKLLRQRQELGRKISAKLKHHGLIAANDDEETEIGLA
jgi:hypothetical protein